MTSSTLSQPAITVRPVESVDEYRACQEIQRRAWGITEEGYVVPVATMISVQHAGGLVLGAFEGDRLVGFAFAYLGRVRGQWALYSQLAGVDPSVQDRGVGGQLKLAQRAWAKEQGLALVAWSFDPLQAGNANFNLHRLGAFCRTYEVNYFGERTDALNTGLDTDRLLAEWPVEDTPCRWQGEGMEPVDLIPTETVGEGLRRPAPTPLPPPPHGGRGGDGGDDHTQAAGSLIPPLPQSGGGGQGGGGRPSQPLHLDIPPNLNAIKSHDPALARTWQLAVRDAFQRAFAAGYVAMDFARETAEQGPRTYYILRRPAEAME